MYFRVFLFFTNLAMSEEIEVRLFKGMKRMKNWNDCKCQNSDHASYEWCGVPKLSPSVMKTATSENGYILFQLDDGPWTFVPDRCLACEN